MGSAGFIYISEILIMLFIYATKDVWMWHIGMVMHLLMLPLVLGSNWSYVFISWKENEFGRISEEDSLIALRDDSSNPLYVKGCFRKNYNKNPRSRMAKLKGNYFCQCVAIIQMLIMVIRIIYIIVRSIELGKIGIYYGVIWPDIVIIIWLMLNLILASVFHTYYNYLFKKND